MYQGITSPLLELNKAKCEGTQYTLSSLKFKDKLSRFFFGLRFTYNLIFYSQYKHRELTGEVLQARPPPYGRVLFSGAMSRTRLPRRRRIPTSSCPDKT